MGKFYFISILFHLSIIIIVAGCTSTTLSVPAQNIEPSSSNLVIDTKVSKLDTPWAMDFAADGRIFITERSGRVRIVKDGALLAEPWLVIDTVTGGEAGLLGLALDPDFAQNRYAYVAYTYRISDGKIANRLVRLRENTSTNKGTLDKVLLDGITGAANHNGGRVKFGPDGKLYLTMGEAQKPDLSQNLSSLNGKILRINPDGTVPHDNPFPGSPVYSYGHRNPQGLTWQPGTGRLYATEHGPSGGLKGIGQDEVNYIEPGRNYGWPLISGSEVGEGMVTPLLQSGQSETWAPSGATFVTVGPWAGAILFTGLRGQALYRLTLDADSPTKITSFDKLLTNVYGRLRDVAQGPDKAIYILTSNRDGRGSPSADDDQLLRMVVR